MKRMILSLVALASGGLLWADVLVQPTGTAKRSVGDGTVLEGAAFPEGALEVTDGTVTIAGSWADVALDDDLKAGLGFWADANRNCILNGSGGVEQWADVRESFADGTPTADHAFVYKRAMVYHPTTESGDVGGTAPTFKEDARHPGRKFLNFGDFGSGKWMYLADPSGALVNQPTLTFYCVVGFENVNNAGFLLCDVTTLAVHGGAEGFFHKASGSRPDGPIGNEEGSLYQYGETRLNGVRIRPAMTYWDWTAFQTFGHVGPAKQSVTGTIPYFNTLCNHGNYPLADSASGYRHGGAVFGEILVWDRVLTEPERRRVEAYLTDKWFARPAVGRTTLPAGASLVSNVGTTNLTVTSVSGNGTLVKRGLGKLSRELSDGSKAAKTQLEGGEVSFSGGVAVPQVVPVSGVAVAVSPRKLSQAYSRSGGTVAKLIGTTDADAVAWLDPDDADGLRVSASNLVVKLGSRAADAAYVSAPSAAARHPENLLANASFETPKQAEKGFTVSPSGFTWTCGGSAGVGVATTDSAWYTGGGAIPDGTQFAFVQGGDQTAGVLSQSFNAPEAGLYRVTFAMTRRTSRGETPGTLIAKLSVDGVEFLSVAVYRDTRGEIDYFKVYGALLPPLTAGDHILAVTVADNQIADRALALDDFHLTLVENGTFVYVPNGGFQSCEAFNDSATSGNGFYKVNPTDTGWTGEGTGNWGITQNSSWHLWETEPSSDDAEEFRAIFLQKQKAVSRTISFAAAGRYVLSMKNANRANFGSWPDQPGTPRATGHATVVYLDNVEIGRAYPAGQEYRLARLPFETTAGEHVLKIANVLPTGREDEDMTSIVDDIRIKAVPTLPVAGQDAFMEPLAHWSLEGASTTTNATDGSQTIFLPKTAEMTTSFAVASNGFYFASLTCAGLAFETNSPRGVYNDYLRYPAIVDLLVDGERIGTVVSESDAFVRRVFRLPYLKSGVSHTLEVRGVTAGAGTESQTRISNVEVEPLAVPETLGETGGLRLDVLSDATLDLQYLGSLKIRSLRLGGKRVYGTISAETHPDFVSGPGSIDVDASGLTVIVR